MSFKKLLLNPSVRLIRVSALKILEYRTPDTASYCNPLHCIGNQLYPAKMKVKTSYLLSLTHTHGYLYLFEEYTSLTLKLILRERYLCLFPVILSFSINSKGISGMQFWS